MPKSVFLPLYLLLGAGPVAHAQMTPAPPAAYKKYTASLGILANPKIIGLQAEVKFLKNFGARLGGIQVFDHRRQNEFGGGGIGLLTYYVPLKNARIEPVLGIGGVYSLYHWDLGFDKGNLTDLDVGGGLGVNLRFSSDFRLGFSVLAANGFVADYVEGRMRTVGRKLVVMPALTFDVLL